MNLGDKVLHQFYEGSLDATQFLLLELQRGNTRLTKFLFKEFTRKRIRINVNKLKELGKCPIAYGQRHEWWLVDTSKVPHETLAANIKPLPVNIDYVLPIASKSLLLVAIKRKNEKTPEKAANDVGTSGEVVQVERPENNTGQG